MHNEVQSNAEMCLLIAVQIFFHHRLHNEGFLAISHVGLSEPFGRTTSKPIIIGTEDHTVNPDVMEL